MQRIACLQLPKFVIAIDDGVFSNFYNLSICLEVEHFDVPIVINVMGIKPFIPIFLMFQLHVMYFLLLMMNLLLMKYFQFIYIFEVNEKEFNNVNRVNNHRANKHMEVQVKNVFDEW